MFSTKKVSCVAIDENLIFPFLPCIFQVTPVIHYKTSTLKLKQVEYSCMLCNLIDTYLLKWFFFFTKDNISTCFKKSDYPIKKADISKSANILVYFIYNTFIKILLETFTIRSSFQGFYLFFFLLLLLTLGTNYL